MPLTQNTVVGLIDGDATPYLNALQQMHRGTVNQTKKTGSIWRGFLERIGHRITDLLFSAFRKLFNFIVQGFKKAINSAIEFEKMLAEIGTLGAFNLEKIGKSIDETAIKFGKTLKDTAESYYEALSAGIPEDQLRRFFDTVGKLSVAGLTPLKDTTNAVAAALNAYGLKVEEVDRVANSFMMTVQQGKTTLREYAPVVGRLYPLFNSLGISLEEVNAAMAQLTRIGMPTSEAATSMKALAAFLSKAKTGASEAAKSFKQSSAEMLKSISDMTGTVLRGNFAWDSYLRTIKQLAPLVSVGRNVGITIDMINESVKSLAQMGTNPRQGISKVQKVLQLMEKNAFNLEQQLKKAGLSMQEAFSFLMAGVRGGQSPQAAMKRLVDFTEALVGEMVDFTKAAKDETLVGALRKLGTSADEIRSAFAGNVEAMQGALGIMQKQGKFVEDLTMKMKTDIADGIPNALNTAFEEINRTTWMELQKSMSKIEVRLKDIGTKLLPTINNVLQQSVGYLQNISTYFDNIADTVRGIVTGWQVLNNSKAYQMASAKNLGPRTQQLMASGQVNLPGSYTTVETGTNWLNTVFPILRPDALTQVPGAPQPESAPINVNINGFNRNPREVVHELKEQARMGWNAEFAYGMGER